MEKASKPSLGQWYKNKLYFSDTEKRLIIEDYLSGRETKQSIYFRYTGYPSENGKILLWMRKFGIADKNVQRTNYESMSKLRKSAEVSVDEFETLQLRRRIAELEKQLQTAELKAIAYSTMVDIAEKEFNIPIRKKYTTKPPK